MFIARLEIIKEISIVMKAKAYHTVAYGYLEHLEKKLIIS